MTLTFWKREDDLNLSKWKMTTASVLLKTFLGLAQLSKITQLSQPNHKLNLTQLQPELG
jgi:hypothetical protein